MLSSLSLSFGRLMIPSSICRVTAIYGEPNERITETTATDLRFLPENVLCTQPQQRQLR